MKQLTKSLLMFLLIAILLLSNTTIMFAGDVTDPIGGYCISSPYMSIVEYK